MESELEWSAEFSNDTLSSSDDDASVDLNTDYVHHEIECESCKAYVDNTNTENEHQTNQDESTGEFENDTFDQVAEDINPCSNSSDNEVEANKDTE